MSERVSRAGGGAGGRGLGARLAATFVAPAEGTVEAPPVEVAATSSVAVLCRPDEAWPAGSAVALGGRGAAAVAVVGEGVAAPTTRAPATRAARKLSDALTTRGHTAVATGRLVHVVAGDPAVAVRIAAVADPGRCVTVVAGPRDDAVDALLRDQDDVLVDADDAVADLALTSLAQSDIPARRLAVAAAPATAKALAVAGLILTPQLRALVAEALR